MQLSSVAGLLAVIQAANGQGSNIRENFSAAKGMVAEPEALTCDSFSVYIESDSDLSSVSSCSTLSGSLVVAWEYDGAFDYPGVTSISGGIIAGNPGASHSSPTLGTPAVTSISLPDLESLDGGIDMSSVPQLSSLSVPKLNTIDGSIMISGIAATSLSFPALESLSGRSLFYGDFDSISFPALKSANYIFISSTGNLDCAALYSQLSGVTWDLCTDDLGCDTNGFECTSATGSFDDTTSPAVFTLLVTDSVFQKTDTILNICTPSSGHYCTGTAGPAMTSSTRPVSVTPTLSAIPSSTLASSTSTKVSSTTSTGSSLSTTTSVSSTSKSTTSSQEKSTTSSQEKSTTTSVPSSTSSGIVQATANAGSIYKPAVAFAGAGMAILAAF